MKIREEELKDVEAIWRLNVSAFETEAEADLVNALRDSGCTFISLVAEIDSKPIGHVLFTPVQLTASSSQLKIIGLAPMAVLKQYQNKGIGSDLVKSGIALCKSKGYDAIVVLGHPGYYAKFGFVPSVKYSIRSEYEVPEEVFMILELIPNSLQGRQGIIKYHELFNSV